ncbi:MAG: CHAT domain-containing tetratricopeptide repeat protein [Saprospiraceae bacterium]
MKKKTLIFGWLICLSPVSAGAQAADTAGVVRVADSLILVARALVNQRDFDQAIEVITAAEKLTLEKLGHETATYAGACYNHGRAYYFQGDFPAAEKWYLEALNIRERVLGKQHRDYAQTLNNLANLYWKIRNYEKAEQLNLQALSIRGKILGKEDLDYAASLSNLANVYFDMGDYEKAEPLQLEAKAIREKNASILNPDYAWNLIYLSSLYFEMGDYEKAIRFNLEATAIQEKTVGKEDPDYAWSLNNLANSYWKMGDYKKFESLNLEAKDIREKALGKEHIDYAWSLLNLANLYFDLGNYGKAELFYLEAKPIFEKASGNQDPKYAWILNNLGNVYRKLGNYELAEKLHLETKAIREKVLGKGHPDFSASLYNLANLYCEMGRYNQAEPLFEQLAYLNQSLIVKALRHSSERESNIYLRGFSLDQDQILSFTQITADKKFDTPQICYDNSLFYKGILLYAANQVKRIALSDSASSEKFYLLRSYERRLAIEYTKPISERKNVAELEEAADLLEKDLARTTTGYGKAMRQVKWQEVQAALKPGEAAVEFVHYRYAIPSATDSIMYAALVLRQGDIQPVFVPLFEEKALAMVLHGTTGSNNFLKINALYAQKSAGKREASLYELIWQPLEALFKMSNSPAEVRTVYCSPTGLLHRINLAAIPGRDEQPFGDHRQIVVLGSTRQVAIAPASPLPPNNNAYLAGGIRYDTDSITIACANRIIGASPDPYAQPNGLAFQTDRVAGNRNGALDYLTATAVEVHEIGQMLHTAGIQAKVDTGFYATEETFRQLGVGRPSARIIHLATHGYFFPDPPKRQTQDIDREPVFKMSEHPMIRSGLILAGAKQAWLTGKHPAGLEDGILTAYEISQMDLSGTELVVLSACETGLGDIVGNEGVFGLQRAFKIAGAKYLIMSLWKVDDQSTQDFMTTFYRHWITEKQTIPDAFRATQHEMRTQHPSAYDWAGFVLIE